MYVSLRTDTAWKGNRRTLRKEIVFLNRPCLNETVRWSLRGNLTQVVYLVGAKILIQEIRVCWFRFWPRLLGATYRKCNLTCRAVTSWKGQASACVNDGDGNADRGLAKPKARVIRKSITDACDYRDRIWWRHRSMNSGVPHFLLRRR